MGLTLEIFDERPRGLYIRNRVLHITRIARKTLRSERSVTFFSKNSFYAKATPVHTNKTDLTLISFYLILLHK